MKKLAIVLASILVINKRKTSEPGDQTKIRCSKQIGVGITLLTLDFTTNNKKYQGGIYVKSKIHRQNFGSYV